ncbi:putative signal peptide protein [Puccinia sorghi]|uniref:Putative signal peptide protein n=1 Tax=Puccinia sorghi TaxID=27349 RepID=A0A0L6UMV8_9BASI|nr:putative signal peptide protein [Puccinia sorghi]
MCSSDQQSNMGIFFFFFFFFQWLIQTCLHMSCYHPMAQPSPSIILNLWDIAKVVGSKQPILHIGLSLPPPNGPTKSSNQTQLRGCSNDCLVIPGGLRLVDGRDKWSVGLEVAVTILRLEKWFSYRNQTMSLHLYTKGLNRQIFWVAYIIRPLEKRLPIVIQTSNDSHNLAEIGFGSFLTDSQLDPLGRNPIENLHQGICHGQWLFQNFILMQFRGASQCLKISRALGAIIQKLSRHCGTFKIILILFVAFGSFNLRNPLEQKVINPIITRCNFYFYFFIFYFIFLNFNIPIEEAMNNSIFLSSPELSLGVHFKTEYFCTIEITVLLTYIWANININMWYCGNSNEWAGIEIKCVELQRNGLELQVSVSKCKGMVCDCEAEVHKNSKEWPGTGRKFVAIKSTCMELQGSAWKFKGMPNMNNKEAKIQFFFVDAMLIWVWNVPSLFMTNIIMIRLITLNTNKKESKIHNKQKQAQKEGSSRKYQPSQNPWQGRTSPVFCVNLTEKWASLHFSLCGFNYQPSQIIQWLVELLAKWLACVSVCRTA